jgi:hypothetical protein
MAHYKPPAEKASETVTFRLTVDERALLDHLAAVEGVTLTDLFRDLLSARAAELGVDEAPPPAPRRRPGRPPKHRIPSPVGPRTGAPVSSPEPGPERVRPRADLTFGDLIRRFDSHFADRGESTRAGLAGTIAWVTDDSTGEPLLDRWIPLREIGSGHLERIRDRLKELELRVAQKNLYLTYLRMLFVFAVKEPDMEVDVAPEQGLAPLTAREAGATWSVPPPAPEEER